MSNASDDGWAPDPQWKEAHDAGKTRLLSTLRKGDRFRCISGNEWEITGWFGWKNQCPNVRSLKDGTSSVFAGCASGLVLS